MNTVVSVVRFTSVPKICLGGLGLWIVSTLVAAGAVEATPAVPVPTSSMQVVAVTSQQAGSEASQAIDGDPETYWHSKHGTETSLPQSLTIDLGRAYAVCGVTYQPRPDGGNGTIDTFSFQVSRDGATWVTAVEQARFKEPAPAKSVVRFAPQADTRWVRLIALTATNKKPNWASAAEVQVLVPTSDPPVASFHVPVRQALVGRPIRVTDTSSGAAESRVWQFPGGQPGTSTEATVDVVYASPGRYGVSLTARNANGTTTVQQPEVIDVLPAAASMAVWLDGRDNELLLGMGRIQPPWTVEMWVKGDGDGWRRSEVLLGAGQYAEVHGVDPVPLELRQGRPASVLAGITAAKALDDGWHHLAVSCDGKETALYVDAQEAGRAPVAHAIIPGALGNHMERVFGGAIDEVRIWQSALPQAVIAAWCGRDPNDAHPHRASLCGWWSFEDWNGEISYNRVGVAPLTFHLRNGRLDYKGHRPLAYTVVSDNPQLRAQSTPGFLFQATVVRSEWPVIAGSADVALAKLRLVIAGDTPVPGVTAVTLDLSASSQWQDVTQVQLVRPAADGHAPQVLAEAAVGSSPLVTFAVSPALISSLAPGVHHLQINGTIAGHATPGRQVQATVSAFTLGERRYQPQADQGSRAMVIHPSPQQEPASVRVLQWNIWHGGRHLGPQGPRRVLDLIRATRADLITMQEAYGAQEMLAKELGYHLHTTGSGGNLAIFSRFPLRVLPTKHSGFQSILVEVTLPSGRTLLLADWWLRYASYGDGSYLNPGEDTATWVTDDERLSTADATSILAKDIHPNWPQRQLPLIIGGDFNSGSHLDWTAAAAAVHGGYGPVPLPTSRLMATEALIDSFRACHPNEVLRPDGTFAVVYGHLQHCRIDYLYHHGVTALFADILRTAPEIDTAWPSDHAAVLTVYRVP